MLLGSNYALLAIGYTLVFGVVRLLTLAHGQVFMASGVAFVLGLRLLGLPLAAAIVLGLAVGVLGGVLTDVLCFRPVSRESEIGPAVATIGLAIAVQEAVVIWRGSNPIGLPLEFETVNLRLAGIRISVVQLVALLVSVVLMLAIHLFVNRTRWGAALRATGEDPSAVQLVGIDPKRVATLALVVSGLIAGAGSVLLALRVGSVSPFYGFEAGLVGLAIIAVAGLGSLTGAMVVGVALGVGETFASRYGLGGFESTVPWILVIVVLLVRPEGLFGASRQ